MNIEVKNSIKPVDYLESIDILEKRMSHTPTYTKTYMHTQKHADTHNPAYTHIKKHYENKSLIVICYTVFLPSIVFPVLKI